VLRTGPRSASAAFRQAIIAEILNPKTALFFLAFLPQFVRPENGSVLLQMAIFGLILVAPGLLSTITFAIGAGRIGAILRRRPLLLRWQGKIVGAIYCALGVRLAFQER
jgi:threonine/homoserine/homoserine lactone efflux protein